METQQLCLNKATSEIKTLQKLTLSLHFNWKDWVSGETKMKMKASSQNSYLLSFVWSESQTQALLQHINGEQHLRLREQRKAPRAHSMCIMGMIMCRIEHRIRKWLERKLKAQMRVTLLRSMNLNVRLWVNSEFDFFCFKERRLVLSLKFWELLCGSRVEDRLEGREVGKTLETEKPVGVWREMMRPCTLAVFSLVKGHHL